MEFTNNIYFSENLIENKKCQITYSGRLFKNNSDEITMVYGFGDNWDYTTEKLMEKSENGFITEIEMLNFDKLNFCFRNSNNEWDNNNNCNYVVPILPPILPVEDTDEKTSLLEDILSDTPVEEAKQFNIDALIEEILNPVINYSEEAMEKSENISLMVDDILESSYIQDFETQHVEQEENETIISDLYKMFDFEPENIIENKPVEDNAALVSVDTENKFLVSPRKLSAFYMIRKKIKVALYKAIVTIPKLLSGKYEDNKN